MDDAALVFASIVAHTEKFIPVSQTIIHRVQQLKFMLGNVVLQLTRTNAYTCIIPHKVYCWCSQDAAPSPLWNLLLVSQLTLRSLLKCINTNTHAHLCMQTHKHLPWALLVLMLTYSDTSPPLAFAHTYNTYRPLFVFAAITCCWTCCVAVPPVPFKCLYIIAARLFCFFITRRQMCFRFPQTPAEGAATVVHAALSSALEGQCEGGYWANGCREMTTPPTFDPKLKLSLWETSLQLLGLQ